MSDSLDRTRALTDVVESSQPEPMEVTPAFRTLEANVAAKAGLADQRATDAATERQAAQTARTGAETARSGAETARAGAAAQVPLAAAQVALAGEQVTRAAEQVALAAEQVDLAAGQVDRAAAQVALASTQRGLAQTAAGQSQGYRDQAQAIADATTVTQDTILVMLAGTAARSLTADSYIATTDAGTLPAFTPTLYNVANRLPRLTADVVIYGANVGSLMLAYQLRRSGKRPLIVGGWRERIFGGMATGGLGGTDFRNTAALGGLARTLLTRIQALGNTTSRRFEPRHAEQAMREMLRAMSIPVVWTGGVDTVVMGAGKKITSIETRDGRVITGQVFVDMSYEGDLLRRVPNLEYIIGREAADSNNPYNGFRGYSTEARGDNHNWIGALVAVDPFVVAGNRGSGFLPGVQAKPNRAVGASDDRMQAYNYRTIMTDADTPRRVPFPATPPADWNPLNYELLFRAIDAFVKSPEKGTYGVDWEFKTQFILLNDLGNNIYDVNSKGAFSTDIFGGSQGYIQADYAEREKYARAHWQRVLGLMYACQHHPDPRVPAALRSDARAWGLDRLHFTAPQFGDEPYRPHSLYVREGARLIGDYVHNGSDVAAEDGTVPRSTRTIGVGSYPRDSHHNITWADEIGGVWRVYNEGGVQAEAGGADEIFPVPLEVALPKASQCTNLLVGFNVSATHEAFGAFRMELAFAQVGQALGECAAMMIEGGLRAQDLLNVYDPLRARLLAADASRLRLPQIN